MMVNQYNTNNHPPWERTVPQQMPWVNPGSVNDQTIKFGGVCPGQTISATQITSVPQTFTTQQPTPSQCLGNVIPLPVSNIQPNYVTPSNMFDPLSNPPFDPVSAHLLNQPCLLQERIHPTTSFSINKAVPNIEPVPACPNTTDSLVSSLTPIPVGQQAATISGFNLTHQKRGSEDMEDEIIRLEEPPTKQLLSEQKLFKQFGSLHLDKDEDVSSSYQVEYPDDSDCSDDESPSKCNQEPSSEREQFNRYVYLLFKDKKSNAASFGPTDNAIDRIVREEREKHSKAVILWTPPLKNSLYGNSDSDGDDEEFNYTDHKDFLKSNPVSMTEIVEEVDDVIEVDPMEEAAITPVQQLPDDSMLE